MRLAGKIGIVTAAASGMGRAGALRFAREGAQVAVVDVDAAGVARVVSEIAGAGGTAHGIVADLTKDEDSRRIVWDTVSRFKGLDFVWNHVGHPGPAAVEGIDMVAFDLAIDLNLRTVLLTTEAAIPEMRARGGGSLLFTASTSGLQGSSYSPVYSMCKFGVVGFVKSLAVRLAPEKIRVNAVCPGPIDTPMLRVFVARPDQKSTAGMDPEDLVRRRAAGSVPLGRTGRPEEIANAALFLLSDEASFITGAALAGRRGRDRGLIGPRPPLPHPRMQPRGPLHSSGVDCGTPLRVGQRGCSGSRRHVTGLGTSPRASAATCGPRDPAPGSPRSARPCTGAAARRTAGRLGHLDDPAEVHHRHHVAHVPHDDEVVGDQQVGEALAAPQVLQQAQDLRLHRDVDG